MPVNRNRNVWIWAATISVVVLFVFLWKAAAPVRMRHQFEAQAVAQLANTTMGNGAKFDSIRVISFRYVPKTDAYDVQYQLNYGDPSSPASTWSSCSATRQNGSYGNRCFALFSDVPISFDISLSE